MIFALVRHLTSFVFVFATVCVHASTLTLEIPPTSAKTDCQKYLTVAQPLTLRALRERAEQSAALVYKQNPAVRFDDLELAAQNEQVGDVSAPLSLQQLLGPNAKFVAAPAPTSPDPATINLTDESYSFPVHVDIDWFGKRSSTAAYISLPSHLSVPSEGPIIGPENKVVLVHLHGGGTPTATGKNAMSIGEKLAPMGIPTVALDLPGHGLATRRVMGLETMEGQVDWILAMVRKVVAPGVKIVLSGHSWGGEFATYMWLHSQEPKYKDIVKFIPLAPPIDVSVGGDLHKKLEFSEYWEKNFRDFESQIAPADFQFQANMLNNGKDSDIGAYFTAFSDFDYSTPTITPAQVQALKPAVGFIQMHDGVTYVGREKPFADVFGQLLVPYTKDMDFQATFSDPDAPSRFYTLESADTWKGEVPQGHNGFDAYIPGTKKPLIYTAMGLMAEASVGGELTPPAAQLNVLDYTVRAYANFPAFRELIRSDVEYVENNSAEANEIMGKRQQLDQFVAAYEGKQATHLKDVEQRLQVEAQAIRTDLGMTENLNVRRAEDELNVPELTEQRKVELEAYIQAVKLVDSTMKTDFNDAAGATELNALTAEFSPLLRQLNLASVDQYKSAFDKLNGRKGLTAEETQLRTQLSRLHQKFMELSKRRQTRFGQERDRRLASIPIPSGINDLRSAQRELTMDRSPARRELLTRYIAAYHEVETKLRAEAQVEVTRELDDIALPAGLHTVEDVKHAKTQIEQIANMSFVPEGNSKIRAITRRLSEAAEERDLLINGASLESGEAQLNLNRLQKSVDDLRVKRSNLLRQWEAVWKKAEFKSQKLDKKTQGFEAALENFKQSYFEYEKQKGEWLLNLKLKNQLTEDNVLAMPSAIKSLRSKTQNAKLKFLELREELEGLRWRETLNGHISGDAELVAEATRIANDMFGEDFAVTGRPSARSLTSQQRSEEEYLEARRRQLSLVEREVSELRYHYALEMSALGYSVPYSIERYAIYDLLNRPLAEVQQILASTNGTANRALIQVKSKWDDFLGQLRRINQSKDTGGY